MAYLLAPRSVIRLADNRQITRDMVEWEEYRLWLKAGNTPGPMPVPVVDLDAKRAATWARCRQKRDLLEAGGFPYRGHPMDSDQRAVQRINTAVQAAQAAQGMGAPFAIGWTCMDGHVLDLDATGMMGMPVALAMYANGLHQTARAFKARIGAADLAELDIIRAEVDAWTP